MSFQIEIDAFLKANPDTENVDVLIADINGMFRGKQLPVSALPKIAGNGVYFPLCTPFLTVNGASAEATYDEYGSDPDRLCKPIAESLKPVPWAARPTAQLMLSMETLEGEPTFADPRTVLSNVLDRYTADKLTPVVALEFEFFLFEAGSMPPKPLAPPNGMPSGTDANCFNMEIFSDFAPLLQEIEEGCRAQGLSVAGLVCEYGNGQFEVNIDHSSNVMKQCDDAVMLKRVVRGVAQKHGLLASFMAKPVNDEVGSGLHAHVSLLDGAGTNIFSAGGGEDRLKHAAGGMLATMREATALFAPNANSFRRFDEEWFAPVVPCWGENNRRLAIRLPLAERVNRRFEHRVAGADASPHLVVATILAGAHYGLTGKIDPGPAMSEFEIPNFSNVLPARWKIALEELKAGSVLKSYLGDEFMALYLQVRESEEEAFHRVVGTADFDQYLRIL